MANADLLGRFAGSFAAQRPSRATNLEFASLVNAVLASPSLLFFLLLASPSLLFFLLLASRFPFLLLPFFLRLSCLLLPFFLGASAFLFRKSAPDNGEEFYIEDTDLSLRSPNGSAVRLVGSEASHMTRSLRLRPGDLAELFDGQGSIVTVRLESIDRQQGLVLVAMEAARKVPFSGPQWTVVAACGMLKGGRSDWLIEKCTELGAVGFIPLVTERSGGKGEGRVDRWERVALAAAKQMHHSLLPSLSSAPPPPLSLPPLASLPPTPLSFFLQPLVSFPSTPRLSSAHPSLFLPSAPCLIPFHPSPLFRPLLSLSSFSPLSHSLPPLISLLSALQVSPSIDPHPRFHLAQRPNQAGMWCADARL
ncbi:unnamed protein product [Closterium sp. Yama58-4]|nr:unnamed protein product [Closterium sp. Yama58-4]